MKQALVLAVFVGFVLLLSGCATIKGVTISDAERAVCEARGCGVWTLDELRSLVTRAFRAGHAAGYAAGVKSL